MSRACIHKSRCAYKQNKTLIFFFFFEKSSSSSQQKRNTRDCICICFVFIFFILFDYFLCSMLLYCETNDDNDEKETQKRETCFFSLFFRFLYESCVRGRKKKAETQKNIVQVSVVQDIKLVKR